MGHPKAFSEIKGRPPAWLRRRRKDLQGSSRQRGIIATLKSQNERDGNFRVTDNSSRTSSLRFPEPVCAGIVERFAILSEGGWDAFSKTPTASNSVICFRVELPLEPKPTRHGRADNHAAKCLSSPCRGCCSRWDRWRNGNGKSDGNRRILLPSQRSESAGALVPGTPGSLAHTNELRGIPLAARGRTHRFRSIQGDERLFRYPEGLDAELSS